MRYDNFSLWSFQKFKSMWCCDQRHWTFVGSASAPSPQLAASELWPGPFLTTFLGHVPRSHLTDVTLQIFPSYSKCGFYPPSSTSTFTRIIFHINTSVEFRIKLAQSLLVCGRFCLFTYDFSRFSCLTSSVNVNFTIQRGRWRH